MMNWYKKAQEDADELGGDKWIPVESSWIDYVAYYEPMGYFEVKLSNGREYTFKDVPKQVFKEFMDSTSKGEFFNRVIRDEYGTKD